MEVSYSPTSISGRFGRATMHPLYRKLNTDYYQPELSGSGTETLQRRYEILTATCPRIIYRRGNIFRGITYAASDAFARIVEAVLFGMREFLTEGAIAACRGIVSSSECGEMPTA